MAKIEECGRGGLVVGTVGLRLLNGLAEIGEYVGQVRLELAQSLAEFLDLREFVIEEPRMRRCSSPGRDMSTRIATSPFW